MELDELKALLQRIENVLSSDQYEYSRYFTVGGVAPITPANYTYVVKSPYNTECEYALISGFSNGNKSWAYVTDTNPGTFPLTTVTVPYGVQSSSDGTQYAGDETNNPLPGIFFEMNTNASVTFTPLWLPIPVNGLIYVMMNGQTTANGCFVTVAFRRKLRRDIPSAPRPRPYTHKPPVSRGNIRRLAGASQQESGFWSQYPQAGGLPYHHEVIPVSQDTGVLASARKQIDGLSVNSPPTQTSQKPVMGRMNKRNGRR